MKNLTFLAVLALLFQACVSVPKNTHTTGERIATGDGPEDLILDTISSSKARLLVSCNNYRLKEQAPNGDIYGIDLDATPQVSYKMKRTSEPTGHVFHPHGFDLIRQKGKVYLYVVSHDEKNDKHYVYKYEVKGQELKFTKAYSNPLMNSPNTVVAKSNGGFYISNDQKKRGNQMALVFSAKSGSLVYCDEDGGWAKVAGKLAYPNGLYITPKERYLYASTTRQHQVFKYTMKADGNLVNREKVTKLVAGDNIRLGQNKELLIPAHVNGLKFLAHMKDSIKTSPSIVYALNTTNGDKKVAYANDGSQISAASTAISYKDDLYISQVFQPFILRVKNKVSKKETPKKD